VFDQPQAYRWAFRTWYRLLFRHLARRAQRLLTVSQFSADGLSQALAVPRSRFGVVGNAADQWEAVEAAPQAWASWGLAKGRYFLAVGSANPSKNLERLRQAHQALPGAHEWPLVLVGGRNAQVFATESGEGALSHQGACIWAGTVSDAVLKALYQGAAGLIMPSLYEGFGLPALEAMQCGCPVVAADIGALREVCGSAALWADPVNLNSMQRAMLTLTQDGPLRADLIRRGQAQAARYQWALSALALIGEVEAVI
jgi:glycosyltransferase involved in cell wall biosynthesis